jgi:hypothetical protein
MLLFVTLVSCLTLFNLFLFLVREQVALLHFDNRYQPQRATWTRCPSHKDSRSVFQESNRSVRPVFIAEHHLTSRSYSACQNEFRDTFSEFPVPIRSTASRLMSRSYHCRNWSLLTSLNAVDISNTRCFFFMLRISVHSAFDNLRAWLDFSVTRMLEVEDATVVYSEF